MAIGLSHGGSTVYSSPSPSKEVLVGTQEGVVILARDAEGKGWSVAHRALTDAHISAIIMEPESGLTFAGVFGGTVFASADDGRTWEERGDGITHQDVYSLAATRLSGGVRLYAGTQPAHLFFSDDLGLHWEELPAFRSVPSVPEWTFPGGPHIAHTKHINFAPGDPSTVYASVEVGALLKSTDSGKSWRDLVGVYEDVHRTVINPDNPSRIHVTGGKGLWATSDGGATWENWTTTDHEIGGYPDGLVLHPRQPELMFIGAAHQSPGEWRTTHFAGARISRSRDGGRTWEVLGGGLPDRMQASIEALCLEDWGESCSVFAATTAGEVYATDDAGDHWSLIISGLAPIFKTGHLQPLATAPAG